ncbi:membrane-flanked domain [Ignisphaera aggregans DSM 17230]|uniref:Membrane-flanked domain n=1 Tax=Ignisphaera aggregans (strain DSM 17230 / JCM 13409 / AQ1.S1) TaxID=583356 RepID=E0SSU8_IGNAA|nr:membrane-flanked domain [Ignisphaera aggregans DSM 17230]
MVEEFRPSPKMKLIYWIYFSIYLIPMAVICIVISMASIIAGAIFMVITILIPLIVLAIWIPRFYESIVFRVEDDHVYARYGVWWKVEKRVPYNLVSEVTVRQGPIQRRLGLVNVDVYTPATGVTKPEITLFQLPKDIGLEISSVLRRKVGILSSRERRAIEEEILKELKEIRKLLEERLHR